MGVQAQPAYSPIQPQPSIGMPPPAAPGFGMPPGAPAAGAYPPSPVFAPPPGVPHQISTAGPMGPPPVSAGGAPAPPPMVGLVSGAGIAPPPPPAIVQPPPIVSSPALVAPPPPVPPAVLPQTPGVLAPPAPVGYAPVPAPAAAPQPATGGSSILVGFLVTFQNEPNGVFWPIRSGRTQLGRAGSDKVDIGINDASASSRHATVTADPSTGQAFVQDDGSRNGTFLNEQKLTPGEQRQLHDNDRLRLGSTTLVIKLLVS
jgi:hypothetical protein